MNFILVDADTVIMVLLLYVTPYTNIPDSRVFACHALYEPCSNRYALYKYKQKLLRSGYVWDG